MIAVPVDALASQTLTVILGNQNVQLNIFSKLGTLYMDVYVNNAAVILGVQCENANRIVRSAYLGFVGDFIWQDTQGDNDPEYAGGLGTRYLLQYLETPDLVALGFAA
jgi:hypothetical protein